MRTLTLLCLLALALVAGAAAASEPRRAALTPAAAAHDDGHRGRQLRPRQRRPRPALGVRAAAVARRWVGAPYRWGGSSPAGFDCSGFTSFVYDSLGVGLPHNAAAQFTVGRPVPRSRLRPGDLLFFSGLGHVGLYLGRGRMIHAPQSGDRVRIVRLGVDYGGTLVGARRIGERPPRLAWAVPAATGTPPGARPTAPR